LAAALAFEAPKVGVQAGGVTVDHGLQRGSAEQAELVSATMTDLGLSPVLSVTVAVPAPGAADYHGPEAAARSARYAALEAAAKTVAAPGEAWIMLGHTLDDQAETVLLGLARGSGARSLAGMAPQSGRYLRPLLRIRRAQTADACAALGLDHWEDPQNSDPAFTRTRVRLEAMPALAAALGPGLAEALGRTAELLRSDADALDAMAGDESDKLGGTAAALSGGWSTSGIGALPAAIRHRVLRQAALAAGCPAGNLSHRHTASLDELVSGWHGQRWIDLPGGVRCERRYGKLLFTAARSEDPGGCE
jgi:tRNA(Ile)-lysidine synthase